MAVVAGSTEARQDEARRRLVRILQDAHAGELAAAYAYRGHQRSLWRRARAIERAELHRIEDAEWLHREHVAGMLRELGAPPRARRELLMASIGRFFGGLCFVSGWFAPMYAAGRLEAMNVGQYLDARHQAEVLDRPAFVALLEEMRVEEDRHERWFGDRIRGHWMLRPARLLFTWSPPD